MGVGMGADANEKGRVITGSPFWTLIFIKSLTL